MLDETTKNPISIYIIDMEVEVTRAEIAVRWIGYVYMLKMLYVFLFFFIQFLTHAAPFPEEDPSAGGARSCGQQGRVTVTYAT